MYICVHFNRSHDMCYSHLVQGSVLINTLIKEFVEAFYCARCFSKHWWCIVKASIATALFLRMLEEEKNLCLYLKGDYNDHWWDDVEWFHWTNRIDIPVASASQVQEYTGTARLAFCFIPASLSIKSLRNCYVPFAHVHTFTPFMNWSCLENAFELQTVC